MFSENLKILRKEKGFSQEEIANRLNVVRQTVSKWEKGLSVPDAEMLIKISELFEVSVSKLLGAKIDNETDTVNDVEQLTNLNEQIVKKNRRSRRSLVIVLVIICVVLTLLIPLLFISIWPAIWVWYSGL